MPVAHSITIESLQRDIKSRIRQGQFKPGQRMPTEMELVRAYGLSRRLVRRGLEELRREGLIVRRQGSGTYVAHEASNLLGASPEAISVYSSDRGLSDPVRSFFGAGLRRGLIQGAALHRLGIVFEANAPGFGSMVPAMPREQLAGIMICLWGTDRAEDFVKRIRVKDVPIVVLNRPSEDPRIPCVYCDLESGTRSAVTFLLNIGHRRIGFFFADQENPTNRQRLQGYQAALRAAGLPIDETLVSSEPRSYRDVTTAWPAVLRRALLRPDRPTALVMMNHDNVVPVLEILAQLNLRVPQDVSLIMFDDTAELARVVPKISCIRIPEEAMGRAGVDLLVEMRHRPPDPARVAVFEPEFLMRESVASPPAR